MTRTTKRMAALAAVIALLATACVLPRPLPGEPIPMIGITVDVSAADQTVTVTVATTDHSPTWVKLWPHAPGGTVLESAAAPFIFTVDTSAMAPGPYFAHAIAFDGATFVGGVAPYEVLACNGAVELCDRPYDEVAYATTHNAMSNANDGWLGPNQQLDIPQQLDVGVRALMIDTYRAGDLSSFGTTQVPGVEPNASYLCHTLCSIGSQPLPESLAEIATFLDQNPGEVITLIVESYLSHALTAQAFVGAGLDAQSYVHVDGTPWPTLGELIDADTRLVVLQDVPVNAAYPYLMNVWQFSFETHFSNAVPGDFSCADNRGTPPDDLFILNHFLTAVFGSAALAEQVNHNPLLADRVAECEAFYGRIPNFVTVDFVDIGDTLAVVDDLNGVD